MRITGRRNRLWTGTEDGGVLSADSGVRKPDFDGGALEPAVDGDGREFATVEGILEAVVNGGALADVVNKGALESVIDAGIGAVPVLSVLLTSLLLLLPTPRPLLLLCGCADAVSPTTTGGGDADGMVSWPSLPALALSADRGSDPGCKYGGGVAGTLIARTPCCF